jgi:hypothetical protein
MEPEDVPNAVQVAAETFLARQLNAMFLENAKQKINIDTSPLAPHQRFDSPTNFLQFSVFTEAVRDRLRSRVWSAKVEGWIAGQLGPEVSHMYQMLTRNLPLLADYQPVPGFISEEVRFRGIEDFELKVYNYFFAHEEMLQKVI